MKLIERKSQNGGYSLSVTIPKEIVYRLDLKKGDEVNIKLSENKYIIITKIKGE